MVMKKIIGGLLVVACASVCLVYSADSKPKSKSVIITTPDKSIKWYVVHVDKVVDGDTVDVNFRVWSDIVLFKRLRFLDIDTWEVHGPNKEKGLAAKEYLKTLINDKSIMMSTTWETGKYGRVLAKLYISQNNQLTSINILLRDHGFEKIKKEP